MLDCLLIARAPGIEGEIEHEGHAAPAQNLVCQRRIGDDTGQPHGGRSADGRKAQRDAEHGEKTGASAFAEGDHSEVSFPPVGVLQTRPMDDCAGLSESVCSGSYGCAFSGGKCGPLSCAGQDGAGENKGACRTLAEGCGKDVPADKTIRGCYYEGKTPGDSASACTETTEGSRCLVYSTPCAYNTSTYSLSHSEFHHMARAR